MDNCNLRICCVYDYAYFTRMNQGYILFIPTVDYISVFSKTAVVDILASLLFIKSYFVVESCIGTPFLTQFHKKTSTAHVFHKSHDFLLVMSSSTK